MRFVLAIALILVSVAPPVAAYDQDGPPVWGRPIVVSQVPDSHAFTPTLTFDPAGALHIAWEQWQGRDGNTAQIFYLNNRSGGWSEPVVVSGAVQPARAPALAADAAGNVHLVFAGGERGVSNQIYYAALTADGAWHGPTLAQDTQRKNGAARPSLITDAAANTTLVWMHDKPGGYDIAKRTHYADGSWGDMHLIIKNAGYTDRPRGLAIGETLHVVARMRTDDGDRVGYTQGAGDSWSKTRYLGGDDKLVYAPTLATDGWRLFAAWDYDHDIHFAMSEDGGANWTPSVRVDRPKGVATVPSLTTSAGQLLLVWQLKDRLLFRPMDLGSMEWGLIEELNRDYKGGEVIDAELVSGPGDQAAVVWQQRRADSGTFEVVFAHRHR
jgi:hypothetical protein